MRACLLALVAATATASPRMPHVLEHAGTQMLVQDQPLVSPPGPPEPDADGVMTAEIVNVQKKAVILVQSTNDPTGAFRRQVIRDSWLQVLNRTSALSLPMKERRGFVVWFVVPRVDEASDALVTEEGKKNGDIIFTKQAQEGADDMDKFVSVARWLRVAYFERFDYACFLQDNGFVNLENLGNYLDNNGAEYFYGGHVSSFRKNTDDPSNANMYYAPFVSKGTLIVSAAFIEVLSRDAMYVKHIGSEYDVGLGAFLQPFKDGMPVRVPCCVADLNTVYEHIATPIVVNGVTPELMAALSTPPGELPAQVSALETVNFHINPHPPTDSEPLCTGMDDSGACRIAEKLLTNPDD